MTTLNKYIHGVSTHYHVYIGKQIFNFTRKEFIQHLIKIEQVKKYQSMSKNFKRETKIEELPSIYKTNSGYLYAVVE